MGVSGSIAAIDAPHVARRLMRHGAEVHVVLNRAARTLVTPAALEWATGNPVITRLSGRVEHLELLGEEGSCDLFLVAPATANTLGKIALALDDTPVTTCATTAIGAGRPVLLAPAMHACMHQHPGVQAHLRRLEELGVGLVEPKLAEGKAKMADEHALLQAVLRRLRPLSLAGQRVLLTAGPTREFLDPARCLTNPSSGRMGCELAREALIRGAQVTLVYGPGTVEPPARARVLRVVSAAEMAAAVEDELSSEQYDVFIASAAVADYTAEQRASTKIPTAQGALELRLVPTAKILDTARDLAPSIFLVGFKAEGGRSQQELVTLALTRLARARADLVLANAVGVPGRGFESDTNELWAVTADGSKPLGLASKADLARSVWDEIERGQEGRKADRTAAR